jgi:hypothetical protein
MRRLQCQNPKTLKVTRLVSKSDSSIQSYLRQFALEASTTPGKSGARTTPKPIKLTGTHQHRVQAETKCRKLNMDMSPSQMQPTFELITWWLAIKRAAKG